jgi:hypothetical protein
VATRPVTKRNLGADSSVILASRQGKNYLLNDLLVENSLTEEKAEEKSGGPIFTTADMPELEAMLMDIFDQLDISSAVIERPVSVAATRGSRLAASPLKDPTTTSTSNFGSVLVLGGLPVGVLVAGAVMLIGAFGGTAAISNAYMGLLFLVGGLGLGVTASVRFRETFRS